MKEKLEVPNPHDAFFRHIFARPQVAAEFFRRYLPPEVVARLDLTQVKLEDAAFVDEKLREHFSDLLFRVGLQGGSEAFIYILLEHKSAPDERVALQVLRYMVLAWDRLPAPLPLIIPVVVYHGARPWRVNKQFGGMFTALAQEPFWRRYLPDFEHYLCDLSQWAAEKLEGAEGLSPTLKLLKSIFHPEELLAQLPGIFLQIVNDLPEELAKEQLSTSFKYLAESGRVTEAQLGAVYEQIRTKGDHMEHFLDIVERERWQGIRQQIRQELIPELRQEVRQEVAQEVRQEVAQEVRQEVAQKVRQEVAQEVRQEVAQEIRQEVAQEVRQEGVAELTLRQLRRQVGKLNRTLEAQIRTLPLNKLTQLGEALLNFESREDLEKWLRRRAAPTRKPARV